MRITVTILLLACLAVSAEAHHSVLHYDGKKEITLSGVITKARFGFPHSKYQLEVDADNGKTEDWTITTEDPRDAQRLGFAEDIRAIRPGDELTVVGWPHKFNEREIRGHQLHYPDGRIVMLRRGNYIWPKDILRLDRLYYNPSDIPAVIRNVDASQPFSRQLIIWIDEADPAARAAWESANMRPRLIGVRTDDGILFAGVDDLLACHTQRTGFTVVVDPADLSDEQRVAIDAGSGYISEFNRLLSRWWEQEHESCE